MPLFMDRHDIREATAEDVARAHEADLEIQSRAVGNVLYFAKNYLYSATV